MNDETKNLVDVILTAVGMIGAAVAFVHTLNTWREGQRWKRAEQLDKFIERFESDSLLKLAAVIIDWTARRITFREQEFIIQNDDVLLALRPHDSDSSRSPTYTLNQTMARDALDALLCFLGRLEAALQSHLIDVEPTRRYFSYWVKRLVTMDRHPDVGHVLDAITPAQMLARYVDADSDPQTLARLCKLLAITPPAGEC